MIEDADDSDDLFNEFDPVLQSAFLGVGGITDQGVALGDTFRALDSDYLAVFEKHLIDVGVQHEGSAVDCADSREALGNAAQTEDGVDEGTWVFTH